MEQIAKYLFGSYVQHYLDVDLQRELDVFLPHDERWSAYCGEVMRTEGRMHPEDAPEEILSCFRTFLLHKLPRGSGES